MQGKPSVPAAVSWIITHNPAVYECFREKIVNYHALAGKIKPEVEKLTGKRTTINTIVVAIARYSSTIVPLPPSEPMAVLRNARITLASDVVDVTIKGKRQELFQMVKRLADLSSSLNEPSHLFQLSKSIKVIADENEYASIIRPSLDGALIARETTSLSRLEISLSPEVEMMPGFGLFLTELLYREGISIRQTYIGEETVLILGRDDGPKAYETLKQEIDKAREEKPEPVKSRAR